MDHRKRSPPASSFWLRRNRTTSPVRFSVSTGALLSDEREMAGGLRSPKEFLGAHGREADAVVIRIGLNDAQLVIVDADGAWERWVYHSVNEAVEAAESL